MDLLKKMTNICGMNLEVSIKTAIEKTRIYFNGLPVERMCKVYNSLLLEELVSLHISCRLINTQDLGLLYEHIFVLISSKTVTGGGYYLADLTFSQFSSSIFFKELILNGYQEINDFEFSTYLKIINGKDLPYEVTLENAFFNTFEKDRDR